ncbi:hypothetical protein [Mammaliicoccus sciuri]|uniref:hypothetical protein n=1 Tax=Mammaliicoccus sciuri TaxID=1296 RepID=UPI00080767FE|nr:hypothetical protein [Mammaliicoccus sciuri]OCA12699.1 hypothetical protein BBD66_07755 [Mammaliicoccus sciuri]
MLTVQEQLNGIKSKDELIRWLINKYAFLSVKSYDKENNEVLYHELRSLNDKFDVLKAIEK